MGQGRRKQGGRHKFAGKRCLGPRTSHGKKSIAYKIGIGNCFDGISEPRQPGTVVTERHARMGLQAACQAGGQQTVKPGIRKRESARVDIRCEIEHGSGVGEQQARVLPHQQAEGNALIFKECERQSLAIGRRERASGVDQ